MIVRQKGRLRETDLPSSDSLPKQPQQPGVDQAEAGISNLTEVSYMGGQDSKHLGHTCTYAFLDILVASCINMKQPGLQPALCCGMPVLQVKINPLCNNASLCQDSQNIEFVLFHSQNILLQHMIFHNTLQ